MSTTTTRKRRKTTQEKNKKKTQTESLETRLEEAFTCPICFTLSGTPWWTCNTCGYWVCNACREKFMSPWTCPQCRYPQKKALRAEALERLAENLGLVAMCRHLKCTTRLPITELAAHETQECPYARSERRKKEEQEPRHHLAPVTTIRKATEDRMVRDMITIWLLLAGIFGAIVFILMVVAYW